MNPYACARSSQIIHFSFLFSDSNILNSHLLGPDRQKYYHIFTDSFGDGTHVFSQGQEVACIRWATKSIKLPGSGNVDMTISDWLPINPSAIELQYMNLGSAKYAWIGKNNRYSLYTSLKMGTTPSWIARIVEEDDVGALRVRVTLFADSIYKGLLDPCVIVAVLLFSGRVIN